MAPRRLWHEAADPGSSVWDDTVDELVSLGTTLDPSLAVYVASRDAAQARGREYHRDYTSPQAWKFFQPNPESHGSYFQDWGTEEEVAWKENYRLWMAFVRDFYHRGGRVTVGSDTGFIYNLYGFGLVEEMELLREAGLHPLEIIQCASRLLRRTVLHRGRRRIQRPARRLRHLRHRVLLPPPRRRPLRPPGRPFRPLGRLQPHRVDDGRGLLLIAVLPTYHSIGMAAPLILLFARVVQGLSAGGEMPASTVLITEAVPERRRAFYSSAIFVGVGIGVLLASLLGWILTTVLSDQQVMDYSRRIAFGIGALVGLYALVLPRSLHVEEPAHDTAEQAEQTTATPLPAKSGIVCCRPSPACSPTTWAAAP
ncbi:MFS transporter [Streptomyces sp. NPDC058770]|uniref:MFS transporter n=1 Tax=Streptomyces sp. NPDC058770 TaxID=3346631 RepID=UPI00368A3489